MEKTKYELRNLVIPQHVYRDNRLNWTSARVYAFIYSYTNPFFFSNEHLAEMFDVHEQTISTAIKTLEDAGYIVTTYKVKANGGKTRLCEVAQSERAKSLSREKETQAPNESNHSDKDIKDNNIKNRVEPIVFYEDFADKEWLEAKRNRKQNKGRGVFQGRGFPQRSELPRYERKERTGVHAEDVV